MMGQPRQVDWHPKHFHTVGLGGTNPYHGLGLEHSEWLSPEPEDDFEVLAEGVQP